MLGGRERCKAWVFSLLFLRAPPVHAAFLCCSPVPSLPPQGEKVAVGESPELSTSWKINLNSRGGRSVKPVTGMGVELGGCGTSPLAALSLNEIIWLLVAASFSFVLVLFRKRRAQGWTRLPPGRGRRLGLFPARAWRLFGSERKKRQKPTREGKRGRVERRAGWGQLRRDLHLPWPRGAAKIWQLPGQFLI